MEEITISNPVCQDELQEGALEKPLGSDYQKRSYAPGDNPSSKQVQSASRARFGSVTSRDELTYETPLTLGIQDTEQKFSFKEKMDAFKSTHPVEEQDKKLAEQFYTVVNPKKIPDGHCAKCAFNTQMHFMGRDLQEAEEGSTLGFQKFSYWFYQNLDPTESEVDIEGQKGESFAEYRQKAEKSIQEVTQAGEGVLVSLGEGAHWFNAYNDGKRVWFIDSQTGKGFNLYRDEAKYPDVENQVLNIVKVHRDQVDSYLEIPEWG